VVEWAAANVRRDDPSLFADDPRWARAARLLEMEAALEGAGYGEILNLEPAGTGQLNLEPPAAPSRLSAMLGRAQRRLAERRGERPRRRRDHGDR
jgi:hypothetical protein